MRLVLIDRNGPPGAQICPAFMCDTCDEPVSEDGWVLWKRGESIDGRPRYSEFLVVHDRCWPKDDVHRSRRKLPEFLAQLTYNSTHPFELEHNVEYVAPLPSMWRLSGRRDTRSQYR